ncbi:interferon-induced GTP-binding protein Mx [Staphylotrichum tortipilum]|uniref:Interferon-induced GTP-binding protein Mx n=1 Tax=Staphylotrichum tortipilum TaxID=2831512 RepID=A0AAN6MNA8_9PEZI|nr:interferon-induced GTP-binding protein Mx [Staphylotrichum longicolle]
MVAFATDTLSKLCSEDQLVLLDSIDQLRLQGINSYISLSQIIVCGDQSSGKSSVLEAISGVSFPVRSNLCTRFPTELVLRRSLYVNATVSIVPHDSHPDDRREDLLAFRKELDSFDHLPQLVESAKFEMGIAPQSRAFSKDILRVEVTGPDRPHLTIVDLPGLIHSETKNQTASDVALIQDIVRSYMREPRCIILAVVSAKNDFANQVVLKLARTVDESGARTLGVITKPDDLVPGGEREALYLSLAKNQEVEFRHGWHVLKNIDSEKGSSDLSTRDAEEAAFFNSGAWAALPVSSLGIERLRSRLSKVLLGQITTELPGLMDEINRKFKSCQGQLADLGTPRASPMEQRAYLLQLSQSFQALVKTSVDGSYNDAFFSDAKSETGYHQRIRAIVQNLNQDFASEMSRRGHLHEVVDSVTSPFDASSPPRVIRITRDQFVTQIEELMRRTRGRELPGTFSPMVVADLFLEQCRPWEAIARDHVKKVWAAASCFVKLVIAHLADESTAKALQQHVFEPAMQQILKQSSEKTSELLKPHRRGHPVTCNRNFAAILQGIRRERRKKEREAVLCQFLNVGSLTEQHHLGGYYNLKGLSDALAEDPEPNVERFAANEAMDSLDAYYKVALERFVDDMAVQVIEAELLSALDGILPPLSVFHMSDDQVARIAGEAEEICTKRSKLVKQIQVLQKGRETCERFAGLKITEGMQD